MRFGVLSIVMLGVIMACKKPQQSAGQGPALCSLEGLTRLKEAGAGQDVLAKTCPQSGSPEAKSDPGAQPTPPQPTTWKVQPTELSVIKADPPSYLEKPTLVFVAVKPSDYFNYGYRDTRNSHFAFEMRPALDDGRVGSDQLYGYAARSWARPFFEAVNNQLEGGKYRYATATLIVAYSKRRYDGQSADHVEILAAEVGQKFDMDPGPLMEKYAQAAGTEAKVKAAKDKARQQARAKCPDEKMRRIFAQNCAGLYVGNRIFGGKAPEFDVDYFCRCAANRVDLDWARQIHEGCAIPDTAALVDFLDSDSVVLACRR
ncbi:hypothetical protein [Anaeromyxobacter paludicola]|uniref:Secreted protein n=1 Tax=Anaeromyxobacter paludicola TaxID=2918171 RepID=A0ABN6N8P3_9BACT|nr:hypothetical protein [Anaeromyxobacter paludicola]BDG08218.1 hypothetical protein AMPC_13310 [Anaeromyxobacter paludicola]